MLLMPLRWRRPRLVFVNSMSDLFHDAIPDSYIASVFAVMGLASQHTFQLLTKRHARMRLLLTSNAFRKEVLTNMQGGALGISSHKHHLWPLSNVWLGVSVEDQRWADIRIPALASVPAAVRFLSCEPLLGPVDIARYLPNLHWVIAGGESGPGARPMHPDWPRALRDQCATQGIPYFFKQWGAWAPSLAYETRAQTQELDGGVRVVRVGKHQAGRHLDGRTWDLMPTAAGI
jgi:protein gp37